MKASGLAIWCFGLYFTFEFVASMGFSFVAALAVSAVLQVTLTATESFLWKRQVNAATIGALVVDAALNFLGMWETFKKIPATPSYQMLAGDFGLPATPPLIALVVVCLAASLFVARVAEPLFLGGFELRGRER
ncbi:MAG: hypothetical protein HC927_06620 [Deltaproteobacteria bacterium]|nr:hypothetical protein [Deltaproteobacteria bacterium]